MAKQITDQNASEILASDKLVVIDFWATWCGPCQRLTPIIEQLAEEYEGRAEICKYNVDEGEDLTIKYGIRNIPVVMLIKNGEVVGKKVGLAAKADLQKLIDANLILRDIWGRKSIESLIHHIDKAMVSSLNIP